MKVLGAVLALLGLVLIGFGLGTELSVGTTSEALGGYSPPTRIINIGQTHKQTMLIQSGLASLLGAVIAFGLGKIIDLLSKSNRHAAQPDGVSQTEEWSEKPSNYLFWNRVAPWAILIFIIGMIPVCSYVR